MSEKKFNSKEEFETAVIEKCWKDEEFKNKLTTNSTEAINNEFGLDLRYIKISVVETEPNEIVIGIPPKPNFDKELSEKELDAAAGGTGFIITMICDIF